MMTWNSTKMSKKLVDQCIFEIRDKYDDELAEPAASNNGGEFLWVFSE